MPRLFIQENVKPFSAPATHESVQMVARRRTQAEWIVAGAAGSTVNLSVYVPYDLFGWTKKADGFAQKWLKCSSGQREATSPERCHHPQGVSACPPCTLFSFRSFPKKIKPTVSGTGNLSQGRTQSNGFAVFSQTTGVITGCPPT